MVHWILWTVSLLWPLPPPIRRLCGWPARRAAVLRYWGQLSVTFLFAKDELLRENVPPQGLETPQLQVPDYSLYSSSGPDGCVFFLLSLYSCLTVGSGHRSIFRSPQLHDSNLIPTCCLQSRVVFNANYCSYFSQKDKRMVSDFNLINWF